MTWKLIKFVGVLILLPGLSPLLAQPCDCKTTGNCPVMIQDYGTFKGTLSVVVDGLNDLGQCPLTSVCFSISHTWIGDLSVSLTSPNGTNYLLMADANNNFGGCGNNADNVEVCIVLGSNKPLTNNREYECNNGPCEAGNCCLTGKWTVPCGGVADSVSNAKQAPNCDLNDFNQPGAPANGTWILTVNDMCVEDFGSLNNFSLTFGCGTVICSVCKSDGGSLPIIPAMQFCAGNPALNMNLPPQYPLGKLPPNSMEYGYSYAIVLNGKVLTIRPTPDLSTLPAGAYKVYGFSHNLASNGLLPTVVGMTIDSAITRFKSTAAPFCADFSRNFISVDILPPPAPVTIDTSVCEGNCITIGGRVICGSGQIKLQSWLGCDSTINVNFIPIPALIVSQSLTICKDSCAIVGGKKFCLPGLYQIKLTASNGCDSIINLQLNEISTFPVITPANPPPLSCLNLSTALSASSSSPSNINYLWTGPFGFRSALPGININTPGTYTLNVSDKATGLVCSQPATVLISGDLSRPSLVIKSPEPAICPGNSFDLSTLVIEDLNNTNPIISFHSGTPATSANKLTSATVSPMSGTSYYVLGTGTACNDEKSILVKVHPTLTSTFIVGSTVCQDSAATLTFTGKAGSGATFNWNFDGGTGLPGSGPGPHKVSWNNTTGAKKISLTVQENGCTSTASSHQIEVFGRTPIPTIQCKPAQESVEFSWGLDPNVTYSVKVLSGPTGILLNQNTYSIRGLQPGAKAIIELLSTGNAYCPPVALQSSCSALDCSNLSVNLTEPGVICNTPDSKQSVLISKVTGNTPAGKGIWSGPGITDGLNGIFETAIAGPGKHNIVYTYEDGGCTLLKNLSVEVVAPPIADAGKPVTLSCRDEEVSTVLGGSSSNGPQYTYAWKYDGGAFPGDSTTLYPRVFKPGLYTLTIADTVSGCTASGSVNIKANQDTPSPQIEVRPISCFGSEDGEIKIKAVNNGIAPYLYSLNESPFSSNSTFSRLKPRVYQLGVLDGAGCESITKIEIKEAEQLIVELIAHINSNNEIRLGDSVYLETYVNLSNNKPDQIIWEPAVFVQCDSCLNTFAHPLETTTFKVRVVTKGCSANSSKTIFVNKSYLIFAPSAFSPNGDGINDLFTLFTGPQVLSIEGFTIIDRWGNQVFARQVLLPNDVQNGWDGAWKGEKLPAGNFAWFAEVEFIDGHKQVFDGSINLMR